MKDRCRSFENNTTGQKGQKLKQKIKLGKTDTPSPTPTQTPALPQFHVLATTLFDHRSDLAKKCAPSETSSFKQTFIYELKGSVLHHSKRVCSNVDVSVSYFDGNLRPVVG